MSDENEKEGISPKELLANFSDIFNEERQQLAQILKDQHPGSTWNFNSRMFAILWKYYKYFIM